MIGEDFALETGEGDFELIGGSMLGPMISSAAAMLSKMGLGPVDSIYNSFTKKVSLMT